MIPVTVDVGASDQSIAIGAFLLTTAIVVVNAPDRSGAKITMPLEAAGIIVVENQSPSESVDVEVGASSIAIAAGITEVLAIDGVSVKRANVVNGSQSAGDRSFAEFTSSSAPGFFPNTALFQASIPAQSIGTSITYNPANGRFTLPGNSIVEFEAYLRITGSSANIVYQWERSTSTVRLGGRGFATTATNVTGQECAKGIITTTATEDILLSMISGGGSPVIQPFQSYAIVKVIGNA